MKKILLLSVLAFFGCEKYEAQVQREQSKSRCVSLDFNEFIGVWDWKYVDHGNGWQPLNMGALQSWTISSTTMYYTNIPTAQTWDWVDMQCSYIMEDSVLYRYEINATNDTMIKYSTSNNWKWMLTK